MDTRLVERAVLVTGASRGIGRATAMAFASEGAHVAISYREDERAGAAVADEIDRAGGNGMAVRLDLEDRGSIEAAVDAVIARWRRLDALVANAVRWPYEAMGSLVDADPAGWERGLNANLLGTAATVRAALPHLARSDAGRIVIISSGVSRHGMAGSTAYGAAKGALDGLLASLKWEAGAVGVHVNIVSPGFTVTEGNLERFTEEVRSMVRSRTPSGKLSVPDDVARAVVFLGSPANGNITGAYVPVAGGTD